MGANHVGISRFDGPANGIKFTPSETRRTIPNSISDAILSCSLVFTPRVTPTKLISTSLQVRVNNQLYNQLLSLAITSACLDRFKWGEFKYREIIIHGDPNMSEMTTEILEQNLSKIVLVRLKGGKSLRGRLKGFDQHLNLVLEETEDTTVVESQKKLGLIIVRGDNVVLISPPPR
jgi:small nuclear ribonucleoprotein